MNLIIMSYTIRLRCTIYKIYIKLHSSSTKLMIALITKTKKG